MWKKKLSKTHHCTQCTLSTTIQKMTKKGQKKTRPHCLKIIQNVAFDFYFGIFHKFCLIKTDLSGNTVFKNSPKLTIFGIFKQLLSTQNVNVARFARNIECDFFCDFQTLCKRLFSLFINLASRMKSFSFWLSVMR